MTRLLLLAADTADSMTRAERVLLLGALAAGLCLVYLIIWGGDDD